MPCRRRPGPRGASREDAHGPDQDSGERAPRLARRSRAQLFSLATLAAGLAALAWLVLRSGAKPSRLSYPCQRAALSAAWAAFGLPLAAALLVVRRRVPRGPIGTIAAVLSVAGLVLTFGLWGYVTRVEAYSGPLLDAPPDYRAEVFHVADVPRSPVGDRFPGLDDLIEVMGGHGLKFYESEIASLIAGPEGLIGADDVVVIKINYQWEERGGTNTDVLRGLIRRIADHPDGFTGEVVVCENAQFRSTQGFDRPENNAESIAQSPHDVVTRFQSEGLRISHYDWTLIRTVQVDEYSAGDANDGYVVYPWDSQLLGRISYPKFQTVHGTRISLRDGVWDGSVYDRARLKFINVPVLKSHSSTYGATACTKNYMGVVSGELGTNSHFAIRYGLLGATIGEIGLADLNLLDAIWVNANPSDGPATTYEAATRKDTLIASIDPIAADMWADENVLIPAFLDNGYAPPWPSPSADPNDPSSDFRQYIDASMNYILAAGYDVTNDSSRIDGIDAPPPGEASDPGGGAPFTIAKHAGGYELTWSSPVRGGAADGYYLYRTDLASGTGNAAPQCEMYLGSGNSEIVGSLPDNHGFLVVGRNSVGDGSFGHDSRGAERPSPLETEWCP